LFLATVFKLSLFINTESPEINDNAQANISVTESNSKETPMNTAELNNNNYSYSANNLEILIAQNSIKQENNITNSTSQTVTPEQNYTQQMPLLQSFSGIPITFNHNICEQRSNTIKKDPINQTILNEKKSSTRKKALYILKNDTQNPRQ